MQLQSIERTYIDKVFALCDYYMEGRVKRYSRHLYDIYKLTPLISFDSTFRQLVTEVRKHRATMQVCPSAAESVSVPEVVRAFCESGYYKADYETITAYFTEDEVPYEDTILCLSDLMRKGMF